MFPDITKSEKIRDDEKFIIYRTWHQARILKDMRSQIEDIVQSIADAFELKDSLMLVQMISRGQVYLCSRLNRWRIQTSFHPAADRRGRSIRGYRHYA